MGTEGAALIDPGAMGDFPVVFRKVLDKLDRTSFGNPGIRNGPAFRFAGVCLQVVGFQEAVCPFVT